MTTALAILLGRAAAGTFFALSGYNKLVNKGRHASLVETLKADHIPLVKLMQWWVPAWEFVGGFSLAVGFLPQFMAAVLAFILLIACVTDGPKRVAGYQPINKADWLDDWLYLPEVCYFVILVMLELVML
jgi:uncharacterized membrane protein YphA (DoxX/SURF4 family)